MMRRVVGVLKATYNFVSGDAIVLTVVAIAFVAAYFLERLTPANHLLAGGVFVALLLLGLVLTLGRERASARRKYLERRHT